jgi:DNA-binding NtrC family response regulator
LPLGPEAEDLVRHHSWPGNFRELLDVLRQAHRRATGERIEVGDMPLSLRSPAPAAAPTLPLDAILAKTERRLIELAVRQAAGNRSKAAEILGIWRARLIRRMEQLGLDPGSGSEGGDDA